MKLRKYLAITFMSLLIISPALAEDTPASDIPSEEWERSIAFGFNMTDGNTDTTLLNLRAKAEREKDSNILRFDAGTSYGETDDSTNVDSSDALAEYKRLLTDRAYIGLGSDYVRDEISDIRYRVGIHPVVGYFLLKDDTYRFNVEAGPSYIFEEVSDIEDDYLAPRIAERFEYQISETAKLFEEVEIILSIDDSDNYLVNAEAGVEAAVSATLSLIASVQTQYDNQPGAGLEKNDLTFLTSLALNF